MITWQTPFHLKSLELPNRIVMAPMTRSSSKQHIPGPTQSDYYRKRAEGGIGLIISEGTVIDHKASNGYPNVPHFYGEKALAGWRYIIEEVHQAGAKMFPQLWHVGGVRQRYACKNRKSDDQREACACEGNVPGYAPSAVQHPYVKNGEVPLEMSLKDISDVIEAFAKAAKNAQQLGFDGIELHGAHGYLIDQFFWEYTNRRADQYGGRTLNERTRFAVEIIEAIRKEVGPDFPIDFRFSQWKLGDYSAKLATTPQELESFLIPLVQAGVDIFHCSTRRFWEPEFPHSHLNLAGWTKKITGKPTITVGSVGLDIDFISNLSVDSSKTDNRLEYLLKALSNEEFDLIAIGRAVLADPDWFKKVIEQRFDDVIPFSRSMSGFSS